LREELPQHHEDVCWEQLTQQRGVQNVLKQSVQRKVLLPLLEENYIQVNEQVMAQKIQVEVPLKNLTQIAILENLQEEQIACLL
jgi:hypothetical protein